MIELNKQRKQQFKEKVEKSPYISQYEIWYNKEDLKDMDMKYHLIVRRRYVLSQIGFVILSMAIPAGLIAMYLGAIQQLGLMLIWGFMIFIISLIGVITRYKAEINMENHLFETGIGLYMHRWAYKQRKELLKELGRKRYWFIFLPFSAIDHLEHKDLSSEISTYIIHTIDKKKWPHFPNGFVYNRSLKKDKEFIEKFLRQYDNWSKKKCRGD